MRSSITHTFTAAAVLALWLGPARSAMAQQPGSAQSPQGSQAAQAAGIPKFKDAALQQYLVTELSTIEDKLDKLAARMENMEAQMAKLRDQQQALAADVRTGQELSKSTDTSVTALRASNQEDLLNLKADVARIRRDLTDISDDMRKSAAAVPATPGAPATPEQPKIEGYITQASATGITINLGTAAGVETGMRFGVYRAAEPDTRIGTIEVTEVIDTNNSHAKIVASNPNTKLQFSDIVRPY